MANENKDSLLEGAIQTTTGVELPNAELIFNIIKTHRTSLNAQITDNYIENNTALQDHIAFSPITVTLSGVVAVQVLTNKEAEFRKQQELMGAKFEQIFGLESIAVRLNSLGFLAPQFCNVTQNAINKVQGIYSSITRYVGIAQALTNYDAAELDSVIPTTGEEEPKLNEAYTILSRTFYNRKACIVHTPWKTFQDMYIQNIEITQDDVNHIMDVSVTFKQLKFASVQYGKVNEQVRASYNAAAAAELENNGKAQTNSIAYDRYTPGAEYVNQR